MSNNNKPLNKYMRGDVKKYKIYKKDPKTGNIRKIEFGDPNMSIKRDNSKNRSQFRDRHNCKTKKDPMKAGYHACKFWSKKPVNQLLKNEKEINMSNELEQYITESHFMMLTEAPSKAKKQKQNYEKQRLKNKKDPGREARLSGQKQLPMRVKGTQYDTNFKQPFGSKASRLKRKVGEYAGKVKDVATKTGSAIKSGAKKAYGSVKSGEVAKNIKNQARRPGRIVGGKMANMANKMKNPNSKLARGLHSAGTALVKHPGKAAAVAGVGLAGAGARYIWVKRKGKRFKRKVGGN